MNFPPAGTSPGSRSAALSPAFLRALLRFPNLALPRTALSCVGLRPARSSLNRSLYTVRTVYYREHRAAAAAAKGWVSGSTSFTCGRKSLLTYWMDAIGMASGVLWQRIEHHHNTYQSQHHHMHDQRRK